MSQLHDMITGKRKYEGNMKVEVKKPAKKRKQLNHYTAGDTGFVPHPCSDPVNVAMAKRG